MHKLKIVLFTSLLLLSFTACNSRSDSENSDIIVFGTSESDNPTLETKSTSSNLPFFETFDNNNFTSSAETNTANEPGFSFPLSLLNCSFNENGQIYVDLSALKTTNDCDLFRQYFFGIWEGTFAFADGVEQESLTIDDSQQSYIMKYPDIGLLNEFYEINDHVLAFINRSPSGSTMHWLDTDAPETMYIAWGGTSEVNAFWSRTEEGSPLSSPKIYSLTKSDAPLNEPEENFLSFFKLIEMSQDHEIDFDLLADIEYENKEGTEKLYHNDWSEFYPVYLVSKEAEKIVLKTIVGNAYAPDEKVDVIYTLEKINGEWTRNVEFILSAN